MTPSEFEKIPFNRVSIEAWGSANERNNNWPIVYTINNSSEIYVGETTNGASRMRQHLASKEKSDLKQVTVIFDDRFNKSVCLDLESDLIRYFAADEKFRVTNGNGGITNADYYQREVYRHSFNEIFNELLQSGMLTRTVPEIVNSDLFKYSPFKALTNEQALVIENVLERLFDDLESNKNSVSVIQGNPGTGKTIVAVYLLKLLVDIMRSSAEDLIDSDSVFSDFFQPGYPELLSDLKIGFVVPQQSLRTTIRRVFRRTPGLDPKMVINPFELTEMSGRFDLLVVDEAHRLRQRSNQEAAIQNKKYKEINIKLFGNDDPSFTQLDWVKACSSHQILLLDVEQTVRPGDLSRETTEELIADGRKSNRFFKLTSQMRIPNGEDYVAYVSKVFSGEEVGSRKSFGQYEVKLFENFVDMNTEIHKRNNEFGLARNIAGYGWPWLTKRNPGGVDFKLDGMDLVWNRTGTDWINTPTSIDEVGSIHTVQGYDLNFAGVIVGPELGYDPELEKLVFYKSNYHDAKGKQNNPGMVLSDDDLLRFVCNIYRVLMTRGILGTYVYAVDKDLQGYLAKYFDFVPRASTSL